jgi:hypothetical protein
MKCNGSYCQKYGLLEHSRYGLFVIIVDCIAGQGRCYDLILTEGLFLDDKVSDADSNSDSYISVQADLGSQRFRNALMWAPGDS